MNFYRRTIATFLIVTFAALVFRWLGLENLRLTSESMRPTFASGDFLTVVKAVYNIHLPFSTYELFVVRRPLPSEVVAFSLPEQGMEIFVKRVVALEGDSVTVKGGIVTVNGTALPQKPHASDADNADEIRWESPPGGNPYLVRVAAEAAGMKDFGPVDVPRGHFFALGDNRAVAMDSRTWGPIPYSCLKGRIYEKSQK